MKNITLSAQDDTIDALRRMARAQHKTVNDLFREWADKSVAEYEVHQRQKRLASFHEALEQTGYVRLERKYTREEMNQRQGPGNGG